MKTVQKVSLQSSREVCTSATKSNVDSVLSLQKAIKERFRAWASVSPEGQCQYEAQVQHGLWGKEHVANEMLPCRRAMFEDA